MFIPNAQAETPYAITNCYYYTSKVLAREKDCIIVTLDIRGIVRSNHENKIFDNCSFHCEQIYRKMGDEIKRYCHTKFMDKDGDYFVTESSGAKVMYGKFIYGTGKWKGITGSLKFEMIFRGKPMYEGTGQGCVRNTGTFDLPKK
ncbi:hypothetical protein ACFLZM_05390 [Thermodesulfobacteriota bacterium]